MATSLHSNAFNFMSFISGGVDPRTGLYTVSIALPELKTEDLAGPTVPLALAFSPLNTRDAGYGMGWSLQLSQFSPASQILSLGTGETFKVTETAPDGRLLMKEQKLDSFHAYDQGNGFYRVAHKSGLVEILQMLGSAAEPVALPVEIQSADGRAVTLAYDTFNSQPLLSEVRDSRRRLLSLTRSSGAVEVRLHPDEVNVRFVLELSDADHRVARLVLPTEEQARWAFTYRTLNGLLCISEVRTPAGAHEILYYDDAGHAFPGATGRPGLPRVNRHVSDPGHGQPPVEVHYAYGTATVPNTHNFLGHDAAGLIFEDNGLDNLYRITEAYLYGTTETLMDGGQAVRRIERTFNRFHLMTEQRVTQGRNVKTTSTVYHADDELSFDQQPAYCQLPFTATDTWSSLDDANRVRHETVTTTYDMFGNLLEQIQANGVIETSTWYPVEGENGLCPPDPEGFVRQLASRTVTPAASTHGDPAPVLRTRYRYDALPPVSGADRPWLVLSEEALLQVDAEKTPPARQETSLHLTRRTYINDPADALNHGRPLQERFTLNGIDTVTDYAYVKTAARHVEETVLRTTQTLSSSLDDERKIITLEHSLLSGEALLTRDDTDVEIRYQYDALGRVVAETVAPGNKEYEATRNYRYHLAAHDQDQAWQEVVNVKDVTVRSELDGLNRVVRELRQDADGNNALRDTYAAQYDGRGQLISETQIDWMIGQNTLKLTRHFGYDDWGQQVSETGPDGVVSFNVMNPFGWTTDQGWYMPARINWRQSRHDDLKRYGLTETRMNLFGKPESVERFRDDNSSRLPHKRQSLGRHIYRYDGLGRAVEEIDTLGHPNRYRYDAFDRQVENVLPDDTRILRGYAAHSAGSLASRLIVRPPGQQKPDVDAGERSFDGLSRLTHLKVGPRNEYYRYNGGQTLISERITPGKRSIHYDYKPGLTSEPTSTEAVDEKATFSYDFKTARMTSSSNSQGKRHYDYDAAGNLKSDTWEANNAIWTTEYFSSLLGRLLQRNEVSGLPTVLSHDSLGRTESISQDRLKAALYYDALGRTQRIVTTDTGRKVSLETRLEYDDFDRETSRTLSLDGHPDRTLSQVWRVDDQLQSRHLQEAGVSLLLEEFNYDSRGRLTIHTCSGLHLPRDRYGHEIVSQGFRFDAQDNITLTVTRFADGTLNRSVFSYSAQDTCQLIRVSHSHALYKPQTTDFNYDDDGNLLNDERGQQLAYDSQGRLLSVHSDSGDTLSQFHYDGHNHLVGVVEGSQPAALRFYAGNRLSATIQDQTKVQYLYGGDIPLGQQQVDAQAETCLLMTNASNTVLGESTESEMRLATYSAYGEASGDELHCKLGFNGELRDTVSDWYLLGRGYRAYNPTLMRFHSPDTLSPFGSGGLNPYSYCLGNPIAFQDPTGHSVGKLQYRHFEPNRTAIFVSLLMTAAFTALAATTLGSAPLIIGLSLTGIGADIIGTGFQVAAYSQRDPEKARKQFETGNAFAQMGMILGFASIAGMAKGAGKGTLKGAAGAEDVTGLARRASSTDSTSSSYFDNYWVEGGEDMMSGLNYMRDSNRLWLRRGFGNQVNMKNPVGTGSAKFADLFDDAGGYVKGDLQMGDYEALQNPLFGRRHSAPASLGSNTPNSPSSPPASPAFTRVTPPHQTSYIAAAQRARGISPHDASKLPAM
ncbi:RHS repeat-associated core domain-containing protein [Pseudomonas viridiflava]